jgi:predicted CXXCH cytochrome family protein
MSASIPETSISCSKGCHQLHQAAGGTLTAAAENVALCQSCHNGVGLASGLPINTPDSAVPGERGSCTFGAPAVNAAYGAAMPSNPQMLLRIMNNNVVCSGLPRPARGDAGHRRTPRVSPAKKITALGSTGVVSFRHVQRIRLVPRQIQTGGALATARFRWSRQRHFLDGAAPLTAATATTLDSGVAVTFGAGNYVVGSAGSSRLLPVPPRCSRLGRQRERHPVCRDCHSAWAQDHGGPTPGTAP